MTLTFLPQQESFSIEFDLETHLVGHNIGFESEAHPDRFEPENHVLDSIGGGTHQTGSRKAPLQAKHFFAEVRLNPSKRLLLIKPQQPSPHTV